MFLYIAQLWAEESTTEVIKQEIARNMSDLVLPEQKRPYFIGTHLITEEYWNSTASFGALLENSHQRTQKMGVDVRVGSASFDNRNFDGGFTSSFSRADLPLDASNHLLRKKLWLITDHAYKKAVEEYSEKAAAFPDGEQRTGIDFLPHKPIQNDLTQDVLVRDLSPLATRLSQYSPRGWEDIQVSVLDRKRDHHFISSEGADIQQTEHYTVLHVHGVRKAADGSDVSGHKWWLVNDIKEFPPETQLREEIASLSDWLNLLKESPIEEDYLGPVIFEPAAAAELFRQLLPKQISGTPPQKEAPSEFEASVSFSSAREGRRIFEGNWVVEDRPLQKGLLGSYVYDHEGVQSENITVIKGGVLADVLMSRTPREGKKKSTGHGRGSVLSRMNAMPSNVLITPPKRNSMSKMRKKAIKLSRQVGNDYVLVVRKLTPLELNDSLEIAFSGDAPLSGLSNPLEMVRLYKDGREEPVRGAKFFGVDRRILRDIVMAGPQSSWIHMIDVPPSEMRFSFGFWGYGTSWSAPAILISEMELRGAGGGEKREIPPPL